MCVIFNDISVAHCSTHDHLSMYLDEKLNFCHHTTEKIVKANKEIGVIKKLHVFPCKALLTVYKCFIRSNSDYAGFIQSAKSSKKNTFFNQGLGSPGIIFGELKSHEESWNFFFV